MARTKKINEGMGDVIEALAEFRANEANIRAEYMRAAEKKITDSRDRVMNLMFIKHAGVGPSEIANTTGLSRSTVIRWRADWEKRSADRAEFLDDADAIAVDAEDVPEFVETVAKLVAEPSFSYLLERSEESNENVHLIVNDLTGERIYVLWGDTFSKGSSADNSDVVDRPNWLTDAILAKAEHVTKLDIPGAIHR